MIKNYFDFISENIDYTNIIEFSLLKPDLTTDQIEEQINQVIDRNIKYITILPEYFNDVKLFIDKNPIKISVAIDFPEGKLNSKEKLKEVNEAIVNGADEIEYTINYKIFNKREDKLQNLLEKLEDELENVSNLCHKNSVIIKLIIELNQLNLQQIKKLGEIISNSGIDYVQTSTGQKSDIKKVKFLRNILPEFIKIKVAGEITSIDHIKQYHSYADRIGTSRIFI